MILCAAQYLPAQGITTTGGVTFSPGTTPVLPRITSGNPPNGTQGAGYQFNFTGTCPVGPCNWTRLSGTLPAGTALDADGTLHAATLGAPGSYIFSVKFTDSFTGLFDTNLIPYQVVINGQVPGAFIVSAGGSNTGGCTFANPCNGDTAGFTAARAAVQQLPIGSKTLTFRGVAPSTTEDLVDWIGIGATGRTGTHKTGTSLYDSTWMDADGQKVWILKGSGGNPWDVDTYGSGCSGGNICLWITENGDIVGGFNNPLAYKRFVTPVPVMPRTFAPGTRIVIDTPAPQSKRTANCETDSPGNTSPGDTRGVTEGPFSDINFGGDIAQPAYILSSYYYSGNNHIYHDRERRYYVKGQGRVKWDHATCTGPTCTDTTGTWTVDNTSLKNNIVSGGSPVPNFPCGATIPGWVGGAVPTAGQNQISAIPGVYRLPSTLSLSSTDGGTGVGDKVTWKNYPNESVTLTGMKRITGLAHIGSGEYTVSLPAASWLNFETLYVNGVRRPRPISGGSTHGYKTNNCATSRNDDADVCVAGATQAIADTACGCPVGVTHCAASATNVCTAAGATPWECKNKFKYSGSDIDPTWHAFKDVEIDMMEDSTMSRMRPLSASGGVVALSGSAGLTTSHGCEGGHHYIVENVKENLAAGQWYLDRDVNNDGVTDSTYVLHIKAGAGENLLAADIEVPQLPVSTPLISASAINWFTLLSNNTGSFAGLAGVPTVSGLFFEGDNWQPPAAGYSDSQDSPNIPGALTFNNSSNVTLDGITVRHTTGWGIDFQGTSTHNNAQNAHTSDTGAGGIRFGTSVVGKIAADPADTDLSVPQYNTVTENLIDNPGRIQPSLGLILGDGHHNSFTHNEIANSYVGGISLCFGPGRGANDGSTSQQFFCHDNDVGFNVIYDQPNPLLSDHGGIYAAPSFSSLCPPGTPLTGNPCNSIHDNVIHDIFNNYDLTSGAASSGARGIYCEQGCTNVLIKNNLIYRVGMSGIFLNSPQTTGPNHFLAQNNLVDNNIFAFFGYQNSAFTVNLAKSCIANVGQAASRFTFQHNICYGNFTDSLTHIQHLPSTSWLCFADDLTTQVPCSQRWVFVNNGYWNTSGTNPLSFAVCKTGTCPGPLNSTNDWLFGPTNGAIPTTWQAAWQLDGSGNLLGAGEDSGSVASDPQFVSTVCGAENFHYLHSFAAQGIVPFDFTQAGRQVNTFAIPTVPDLFPVRPINCTDFNTPGGGAPIVSLSVSTLSFGSQAVLTTSSSQTVTLTNTGSATLNVTSVTASGDFAQSNNCIPTVAASAICTITVTFTPTVSGARAGTVSIVDTAAGSPHSFTLTGTGTASSGSGDNRYCTSGNTVTGLSDDTWGTVTAAKLATCINTAIANTPSGAAATPPGTIRNVTDNATFTAALAAMACGDVIKLPAGSNLTVASILPHKGCDADSWITIESTGVDDPSFPPEGTRMSPCYAGVASIPNRPTYPCPAAMNLLAKITVANNSNAFKLNGDHYRFIGLEITRANTPPGIVFNLVDTPAGQPAGNQNHIIFDRCYLHGINPDAELPYTASGVSRETQRGISFGQSNNFAVIDSYLSEFYCISSRGTCSDAQAVTWGFGTIQNSGWGTYKLVNNFLEASTEGILPGGSNGPAFSPGGCTPLVDCNVDSPVDSEIRRNYFFKPKTWNGNTTVIVTSGWPVVKNGFEIKNGVRLLIEGNVVQGTWPSAQTQAYVWSLAPKNQGSSGTPPVGLCPTCLVSDATVRLNYGYDVGGGPGIYSSYNPACSPACPSLGGYRISMHDNLVENMNKGSLSSTSLDDGFEFTANTGSPLNQIAFFHNGLVPTIRSFGTWGAQTTGLMNNWYFDNNYITNGSQGLLRIGGAGTCDQPFVNNAKGLLDACVTTYSFQKNDVLGGTATNWPTDGSGLNNLFNTTSTMLFTNYNGGDSSMNPGNYLLQATSPGHNAGTDGADIGPNISAILTATTGVASGGAGVAPDCGEGTVASYIGTACKQSPAVMQWNSFACTSTPSSICTAMGVNGANLNMHMDPAGNGHTILVAGNGLWDVTAGQTAHVTISGTIYGATQNDTWPHWENNQAIPPITTKPGQTGDGTEENKVTVNCASTSNCTNANGGISDIPCTSVTDIRSCNQQQTIGYYLQFGATFNAAPANAPYNFTIEIIMNGGTTGTASLKNAGVHLL